MSTYHKDCRLLGATATASSKGTAGIALEFDVPEVGRRTVVLWLSDNAWEHSEKKLLALGFNGSFENPEFTNAEAVELAATEEEYEGKTREKWDIAPGGFTVTPAAPDVLRQLSARWRATHKTATPAKSAAPKAPGKAPSKAPEKPASTATNKDDAWEEYKQLCPGKDESEVTEAFYASIAKVEGESRRKEAKFTAADWQAVVGDCIPF